MERRILVEYGTVTQIANETGSHPRHVALCLKGNVKSNLSKKIRSLAIEKGGVFVDSK